MTRCFHTDYRGSLISLCERKNDVIHILWPSQSLDLNSAEHLWEILEQRVGAALFTTIIKHQMKEYLLEEWCSSL